MKINKFLEQVVTVDHVAEVLTEKEIEEAIEQTEAELEDVVEDIEKQLEYIEKRFKYKEYIESVLQTLKQAREMKLVGNSTVKSISDEAREFRRGWENYFNTATSYIQFVVNEGKKTIVALLVDSVTGRVRRRSVAKCHPEDEWDADVGKAIAIGRLLNQDVSRFTDIPPKESLPDSSFVHTTPDGKTFRVVERRAKVGERVVIIDDSTLYVFKVGDVEVVKGRSDSQEFEVIGCRESGFWGYDYLNHKTDYYVIIEELPF